MSFTTYSFLKKNVTRGSIFMTVTDKDEVLDELLMLTKEHKKADDMTYKWRS